MKTYENFISDIFKKIKDPYDTESCLYDTSDYVKVKKTGKVGVIKLRGKSGKDSIYYIDFFDVNFNVKDASQYDEKELTKPSKKEIELLKKHIELFNSTQKYNL